MHDQATNHRAITHACLIRIRLLRLQPKAVIMGNSRLPKNRDIPANCCHFCESFKRTALDWGVCLEHDKFINVYAFSPCKLKRRKHES